MENQSKKKLSIALRPPQVAGLVSPIEGAENYDGGLGIAAFENDLHISAPPWQMSLFDECRLFVQDPTSPIRLEVIDNHEELNQAVRFILTKGEILDGSNRAFYTVTARHQTPEKSTELKLLVKRTRPGGELGQPEPGGHPRLLYRFIPDISGGIDQDIADKGVRMIVLSYPNITIYDRITARWGLEEEVVFYPVTQQNIDDPTNHPIEIFFSKELIERAGKGVHAVIFQVIDRCDNYPHPFAPWAIPTNVSVNLGDTKRLPPPIVEGAQNGMLDPAYLTSISVKVPKSGLNLDDLVHVDWRGRIPRQTPEQSYIGGETLDFPIPLDWARENDENQVSVTYQVRGRDSEPTPVTVKTTIHQEKVKVLEAYGASGDRLKISDMYYAPHATVRVLKYVGMAVGQTIRVRWASTRHTYYSEIKTVTSVGDVDLVVPRMEVIDSIASTVPVTFTVRTYPDGPLHRSQPLNLGVDAQEFTLPPPRLTPDQTTVTVYYPAIASGYQARVRFAGIVTRRTEWQNMQNGVIAAFSIPSAWVEENKGGVVLINYSVNRANVNEQSQFSQVLRVQL